LCFGGSVCLVAFGLVLRKELYHLDPARFGSVLDLGSILFSPFHTYIVVHNLLASSESL
jgi:hypothetical protein